MKVILVRLIFEKKDYCFGSIAAIFTTISEGTLGITEKYLQHAKLASGSPVITPRAIIKQLPFIRSPKKK